MRNRHLDTLVLCAVYAGTRQLPDPPTFTDDLLPAYLVREWGALVYDRVGGMGCDHAPCAVVIPPLALSFFFFGFLRARVPSLRSRVLPS